MRVSCPSCQADFSLDVLLAHEEARQALARLAAISLPFGAAVLRYIALFRPAKRKLSIERMVSLIEELAPDVERQAITRKGREWDAPIESWRAAIDTVLAARDKGTLTTPLTSHGYLYEVLAAQADKIEARQEQSIEARRLHHRQAGPDAEPVSVGSLLAPAESEPAPAAHAPAPAPVITGPSRMVLEMRARLKRQAEAADPEAPPTGEPQP